MYPSSERPGGSILRNTWNEYDQYIDQGGYESYMMRVKDDSEGTVTTDDEADKSDYSPWRTTVTSLSLETLFRGEQQRHAKTAEANEYCLGPISGDCSAAAHSQHSNSHGTSGCRLCCLERKGEFQDLGDDNEQGQLVAQPNVLLPIRVLP